MNAKYTKKVFRTTTVRNANLSSIAKRPRSLYREESSFTGAKVSPVLNEIVINFSPAPFRSERIEIWAKNFSTIGFYCISDTINLWQNDTCLTTLKRPIHAQFNCAVCLSTKLSRKLYNYLNWRWDIVGPTIQANFRDHQWRTKGHLFSCSFCYNREWVTYDQARHLLRTDLTERLMKETAQQIREK